MDREAIEHTETSLMDQEAVEKLSRRILKKARWNEIAIIAIKKGSSRGSTNSLAVERYQEAVEIN